MEFVAGMYSSTAIRRYTRCNIIGRDINSIRVVLIVMIIIHGDSLCMITIFSIIRWRRIRIRRCNMILDIALVAIKFTAAYACK